MITGMFGGFAGIYFAQLLIAGTALIGVFASASGSKAAAGGPFWLGLTALACYTLGTIGGAAALQRPIAAASLMLIGSIGGLVATLAAGAAVGGLFPQPAEVSPTLAPVIGSRPPATSATGTATPEALAVLAAPFVGPLLLFIGAFLAYSDDREPQETTALRTGNRRFVPAERYVDPIPTTRSTVGPDASGMRVTASPIAEAVPRVIDETCPRCQQPMSSTDLLCPSCGVRRNRG